MTINLVFFLFVFTKSVQSAFNFYISEVEPVQVYSKEDVIDVRIVVDSLPLGDSFFKVGIKNSNSYIGYMKDNDGDWVKIDSLSSDKSNNQCNKYFKITSDGEYVLNIKIGDNNDLPNGEYVIKAFRFTSSCGSYSGSSEAEAFKINVALPIPTPSPTPLPTPAQSPEKPKANLKINDARDQNDNVVSGATQIYIDGNYTGNYAPETYTFCDDCKCGSNKVSCGFGSHTIKVEKTGYKSWTKTIDVSAGNNYEETPILTISTPTPTSTPKPSATPKASPTPSLEAENTIQASESGLTLNSSSEPRVLGLESAKIKEDKEASGSDSYFNLAAVFFIIAGLSFLSAASYAYFKSKKKKEEKQNENKDSEDQEDF
ncbi:MAG: hypothetical protein CH104c_0383 [Candidatus Woesebacteria bacterium]|nr:MAG: hypothetical protein CH104c_0383 [Candidatus Woesebacteria bacterium]